MPWNWELPEWPHFRFDPSNLVQKERQFLLNMGKASGFLKSIEKEEYNQFIIEILSSEGEKSSRIEGEILDRSSLQSSIKQQFGLISKKNEESKELRMARLLCDVYGTFDHPLSDEMLWRWHSLLFDQNSHLDDYGKYREHPEPMQIISHRLGSSEVFFEAPPSTRLPFEMKKFIQWYNANLNEPLIAKTAIAHVYFESIHPFEDGNGRIGRALCEKMLSQGVGRPVLIALSKVLESKKKDYYIALEKCNRILEIDEWVEFFADAILRAQKDSLDLLYFLIGKSKMFSILKDQLNPRQEKVLLRMFTEGPSGFKGGLSAENYIAITKVPRATATRDLNDLVQKGALIKTGELRHTRYWLNLTNQ